MFHYNYFYIIAFLVISFVTYEFQPEFRSALIIHIQRIVLNYRLIFFC